ncbi:hypothetical protein COCMIDRAFT_29222 [Bipolaris oryzae ATCC 44560]|uniref:Uncharacterized protein n=1 Tax=Bipolaris oryzae ATCC 44560 TaxID=930090 RepID=W6YX43_COCMI|nr:uncharacterized protein COCMIDRAFT_29222 [Bipolaris oryzae ATCC 44560]EUC42093.1 hypothetical protein COCMIDRAFT_29222 [Bipolaris oryzae ATCC 44560]
MTFQMVVISLLALVAAEDACRGPMDTREAHACAVECVRCKIGCVEDAYWERVEREGEREGNQEEEEQRERADKRRGGIWKVMEGGLKRVDREEDESMPKQETEEYQDFPAHVLYRKIAVRPFAAQKPMR